MPTFEIQLDDGSHYELESDKDISQEEALNAINAYVKQGYQDTPQAEGMFATAGRELASGALPALGTVGGAIAGAAGGTAVGGPVGAVAGDVAGGYAGGQLGQGLMRAGMGELEYRRNLAQLEANRLENPHSAEIGGFAPMIASTLGGAKGLSAAGREAAALGKGAPIVERIAQNAVSGARMDASLSGQRENNGEDTNLLADTARGALAFGVTGFLPHAESIAQSLGKGLGDAALMTIAGEMFDAAKEGRAPSTEAIYEKTGESIPSFLLMNGVMAAVGRQPLFKGRAPVEAPVTPAEFEATKLNEEMQTTFDTIKAEEDAKVAQHAANVDTQVQSATRATDQTLQNPDLPQEAKDVLIAGHQKMNEVAPIKVQDFALESQTEAQARFEKMFPQQEPVAEAVKPNVNQPELPLETPKNEFQQFFTENTPKEAENKVSVPIMVTRDMEQQLANLGYNKVERNAMTPQEANAIIAKGELKPYFTEPELTTIPNENQIQETSRPAPEQSVTPIETPTAKAEKGTPLRSGEGEEVITPVENVQATPEPVARTEAKPVENAPPKGRKVSPKPEPEPIRSEQAVAPVGEEVTATKDSFTEAMQNASEASPVAATFKSPTRGEIAVDVIGKEGGNFVYRNKATGDTGRWSQTDIADFAPREVVTKAVKKVAPKKAAEPVVETKVETPIKIEPKIELAPKAEPTTKPSELFTNKLLEDLPEKARSKWSKEEIELAQKAVEGDSKAFDSLSPIKQNAVARSIADQGIAVDYIKNNKAKNKLVDWADKVITENKKYFNLSVNPELFAAYAIKGAELVAKGFNNFKSWSGRMLSKFGQGIKSYLNDLWAVAQSKKGAIDIGGSDKGKEPEPATKAPWEKAPDNPIEQPQSPAPSKFSSYVDPQRDWRKERGMSEFEKTKAVDAEQWLKAGLKHLEANPEAAKQIAESIIESPRYVTDAELALIRIRAQQLSDSYDLNSGIARDSKSTPEQVKEALLRNLLLQDELDAIHKVNELTGSSWGARGYLLKQQLEADYSLQALIRKRTTEKLGEKPTGEELKKIEDQAAEIKKLQTDLDALRVKRDEASVTESADDKFKEIAKSVARRKGRGEKADTEDIINKESAYIKDKTQPPSQKLIDAIARFHIENGVRNVDALISKMSTHLKELGFEGLTDSKIRTAFSGYGETKTLSQEEVDKSLRDLRAQSRLLEQLKDAKEGVMPKLTGLIRDKPTVEQRTLIKEVNDEISKQELSRKTPDEQKASRLDQVKTRLTNLIEELTKDIKTLKDGGTINNRIRTAVERDTAANDLQKRVDALRKERDELQPKKELSEEQWNKNMTAVAKRMQAEFERRLKEKDFAVKKRPDHKASLELETARAERDAAKKEMMEHEDYKKSAEERAVLAILRRKEAQIERYETKIANKDYEPKVRKPAPQDKRIDELDLEIRKVKNQFMMDQANARRANRTKWQKILDSIPEMKRAMVLSSPAVITKLGAAGLVRNITSAAEELAGKAIEKVLPKDLLNKATLEGRSDLGALYEGVREGYGNWRKDAKDIRETGKTDLDLLYGDKKTYDENGLGTWFGRWHYVMKAPAKRAAFRSAYIRLAKKAAEQGKKVSSPIVKAQIGTEAYKHAQRAIFMHDNAGARVFNGIISSLEREKGDIPRVAASAIKTLFPIVKVPLNIASETFVTSMGGLTGAAKLAQVYMRAVKGKKAFKDALSEDEANMIIRHFKKGSIGAGAMLLGFLGKDLVGGFYEDKEKRKLGEIGAGNFRAFGVDIPSWLTHAPIFEVMQMGATIRRSMDKEGEDGKAKSLSGLPSGVLASIIGVAEETPFVNEMFRAKELASAEGREKFISELVKSQFIPNASDQVAKMLDKTDLGETVKRDPEGLWQILKSGIPLARNTLPLKITDALPPSEIGHIPEPIKKYAMAGGIMPSKPEKGVLLKKNPNLNDEQFGKYVEIRGKLIKEALLRSVSRLSKLDEEKQRNAIRMISQTASETAKRKLHLKV